MPLELEHALVRRPTTLSADGVRGAGGGSRVYVASSSPPRTSLRSAPRPIYLFLGLLLDVDQLAAACLKASLCARSGLAALTLAISLFMKTLYADGSRAFFSIVFLGAMSDLGA